jgi:uncharacterized protein (TIGR00730 family)
MPFRICVFCASNLGARPSYAEAATALARHLAARQIPIVYGGGKLGLMGVLADAALAAGGSITGVMPRSLVDREVAHTALSDLRIVSSMHERKALMAELSNAFIALPGGYGTLEEFCEVLTWTQLGLQQKPCGILNVAGYFDHLLAFLDHAVSERFLKPVHRHLIVAATEPESLVNRLFQQEVPCTSKWIDVAHT